MISSAGRGKRKLPLQRGFTPLDGQRPYRTGFTLLEVLAAFAVLVTALTLIAAAFTRHLQAIRFLTDSVTAYRIADRILQGEIFRRREGVQMESSQLPQGFTSQILQEQITLGTPPVDGLAMERVRAQVDWSSRGQARSSEVSSGFLPAPPES